MSTTDAQDRQSESDSSDFIENHVCLFLPLQYLSEENTEPIQATSLSSELDYAPQNGGAEIEDTENTQADTEDDPVDSDGLSEEDKREIALARMRVFQTLDYLDTLKTPRIIAKPPTLPLPKDHIIITKNRLVRDLEFCNVDVLEDLESTQSWPEGADMTKFDDGAIKPCYNNLGIFLDFMAEVFKRDSLDNAGGKVVASVNYEFDYPNAFYSSALGQVIFGNGFSKKGWMSGDVKPVGDFIGITGDFATGLDVVSHELMHAVTQYTVANGIGLDYSGESGAIAESIADVFGIMTKQWHDFKTDPNWKLKDTDWIIGKTAILPGNPEMGLRSLKDPGKAFEITTKYKVFKDLQIQDYSQIDGNSEVHIASGIPNKAFYQAVQEIGGLPWEKTGQIWYRALIDQSLKRSCSIAYFAHITFRNAEKYGKEINEADLGKKVQRAWRSVGVKYDTWDDE